MDPITVFCPRGLGDAVICLPACYALAEGGRRVNLVNGGPVHFAATLPTLIPIGTEREGEVLDVSQQLSWHSPLRMLAQVSLKLGVYPLAIPGEPWLKAREDYAAIVRGFGVEPGEYVFVAPRGSQDYRRLDPEQIAAVADAHDVVCGCDRALPDMPGLDLTGKTTLPEFYALTAMAKAVVTVDGGTLHLAGALGVPTLAVIGGSINPYSLCLDYTPSLWLQHAMDSYMVPPDRIAEGLERLLAE